jgi:hypothetical protein
VHLIPSVGSEEFAGVPLWGDRERWMMSVGAVIKAWAMPGVPCFPLLDSRGRVIEAHFQQAAAQLTRMLAERRATR